MVKNNGYTFNYIITKASERLYTNNHLCQHMHGQPLHLINNPYVNILFYVGYVLCVIISAIELNVSCSSPVHPTFVIYILNLFMMKDGTSLLSSLGLGKVS